MPLFLCYFSWEVVLLIYRGRQLGLMKSKSPEGFLFCMARTSLLYHGRSPPRKRNPPILAGLRPGGPRFAPTAQESQRRLCGKHMASGPEPNPSPCRTPGRAWSRRRRRREVSRRTAARATERSVASSFPPLVSIRMNWSLLVTRQRVRIWNLSFGSVLPGIRLIRLDQMRLLSAGRW